MSEFYHGIISHLFAEELLSYRLKFLDKLILLTHLLCFRIKRFSKSSKVNYELFIFFIRTHDRFAGERLGTFFCILENVKDFIFLFVSFVLMMKLRLVSRNLLWIWPVHMPISFYLIVCSHQYDILFFFFQFSCQFMSLFVIWLA